MRVGGEFPVRVRVNLGAFTPDDVEVQLFHGVLDAMGEIADPRALALRGRPAPRTARSGAVHRQRAVPRQRPVRLQRPRAAEARQPAAPRSSRAW